MKTSTKIGIGAGIAIFLLMSKNANATDTNIPIGQTGGGAANWTGFGTYKGSNGSLDESYLGMKTVRGIRNNNPGNIKTYCWLSSYVSWNGELTCAENTDGVFCQFKRFADGVRAMIKLLKTYKTKYQINTIDNLISRWDCPTAQHYKDFVSDETGFSISQIIDLHDKDTLKKICTAMIKLECDGFTLSSAQFETGYSLV